MLPLTTKFPVTVIVLPITAKVGSLDHSFQPCDCYCGLVSFAVAPYDKVVGDNK